MCRFRQSEIDQNRGAVLIDKNIARLDIAMRDALAMCVFQSLSQLINELYLGRNR